jgi:hypothetical protein
LENLKEREHFGDVGIDGRIILKWNLKKYGSRWGPMAGCCENGKERFGSINGGEILYQYIDYYLTKDSLRLERPSFHTRRECLDPGGLK